MMIQARYRPGIDDAKDQAAMAIAKKYKAKFQGSGCWLEEPFERDLEWHVSVANSDAMADELRKAGFKVTA